LPPHWEYWPAEQPEGVVVAAGAELLVVVDFTVVEVERVVEVLEIGSGVQASSVSTTVLLVLLGLVVVLLVLKVVPVVLTAEVVSTGAGAPVES